MSYLKNYKARDKTLKTKNVQEEIIFNSRQISNHIVSHEMNKSKLKISKLKKMALFTLSLPTPWKHESENNLFCE